MFDCSKENKWRKDVEILYSPQEIGKRVDELGAQIAQDYAGKKITFVGILKGSFIFMSDLVRATDAPLRTDFMGISSYGDDTESSGVVQVTSDLTRSIEGEHVVVVEDIIDTGLTMAYLLDNLQTRRPASIKVCTLLHKPDNTKIEIPIDYVGFTIPNHFVIGYGLDLANVYRNLPFIGVYHGEKEA